MGWQALVMRGKEVGHFHKVAGMSIVAADGPHSAVDTVDSRCMGLNKLYMYLKHCSTELLPRAGLICTAWVHEYSVHIRSTYEHRPVK